MRHATVLKRCVLPTLLFVLFTLFVPMAGAENTVPAYSAKNNGCPYYICVNRAANTVTVYGLDDNGYYTVPVKAMVCSVGREGHSTPLGTFSITGVKKQWCFMVDGTYGQYSSQFRGNYLFHSICYRKANPATMLTDEYNMLGERASRGCVRLQVIDAKWIYDNCKAGTKVTIYDNAGDPGPLGNPLKAIAEIPAELANGWDPTDPRENNPWNNHIATAFAVTSESAALEAGQAYQVSYALDPPEALLPRVVWTSSDPSVASVDETGRVTALSVGTAVITGICGEFSGACTVTVSGTLLPFSDIPPGMWNYREIRYASENGIVPGVSETVFAPDGTFTWADALQSLYQLAGTVSSAGVSPYDFQYAWYRDALDWAKQHSLTGLSQDVFEPGKAIARKDFALLLYRYDTLYLGYSGAAEGSLGAYSDMDGVEMDDETAKALLWAVNHGILTGGPDGTLNPGALVTRSHAALLFYRYSLAGHSTRLFQVSMLMRRHPARLFAVSML